MQDTTRGTAVRARLRTRIGSALLAVPLALALGAAPALAAANPHLSVSPGRGPSGLEVTLTMKNCSDPRLWLEPTINGSSPADAGSSGYIYWQNQGGPYGYEPVGAWVGSGTTWTTTIHAHFLPGRNNLMAWCTPFKVYAAIFTVR
jgi:hypothetical protein